MKIFLNGIEKTLSRQMTIADLVTDLELDLKKIAVEKDLEIISPENFSTVMIDEGARIEIVHFIGGG